MARFVTVAAFGELYLAEMAKAAIEDAGIRAYLADTETHGNLWHLGPAIGGVKVQVAEEDAERAAAALRESEGDREIDEEELSREAMEAPTEEEELATQAAAVRLSHPSATTPELDRDRLASRALWCLVGGIVLLPLWGVGMYYLLTAACKSDPLSESGRISLRTAGVLGAVTTLVLLRVMFGLLNRMNP